MQTLSYGFSRDDEVASLVLAEPYRIGRVIGRGPLGVVCEASHARLPGKLAVKVLAREYIADAAAVEQFCWEADLLAKLRHPNMVQLFDFNRTADGLPYYVMEYLDGTDLGRRLETGDPMLPAWIVQIVDQVASVLAAAHTHGLVHRQLSPASIFLTRIEGQNDEFVKVLDLGATKARTADRVTLRYLAPEQALGQNERIDGRTDQFALAAITYAMLTGRDAFAGDDSAALLYQVVHEQPAPLARFLSWDVSRVQAVISRGLAKDQDMRYDSVLDFARALEAAVFHTSTVFSGATAASAAITPVALQAPAVPPAGTPTPVVMFAPNAARRPTVETPLRLPNKPAPQPAVRPAISTAKRRAVFQDDDDVEMPADIEAASSVQTARRSGASDVRYDWEQLPSTIDRIPISPYRAVALAGVAVVMGGFLVAKGWHRELPADVAYFRQNAVAFFRPAPALPQPEPMPVPARAAAPAPEHPAAPSETAPPQEQPTPAAVNPSSPGGEAAATARPPEAPRAQRTRDDDPPARPAARATRSRSSSYGDDGRASRSIVDLLPPRPAAPPVPPSSPSTAAPAPSSSAPVAPTAPASPTAGFSITPPASQAMPDDILPLGADGTPASAEGSEGRAPRPAAPRNTP